MKLDRRTLQKNLPQKGFVEKRDGDHIYYRHKDNNGKRTKYYTKISHTAKMKDIPPNIISLMKLQLGLGTNKQVLDLVNCPISKEQYNSLVLADREGVK